MYVSHHQIQIQTSNHLYLESDPNLSAVSCSALVLSGSSRVVADVWRRESTCPPRPALQTKFNTSIESGLANANRVYTWPTPRQNGAAFAFQFNTSIESGVAHTWKNLRPPSDWGLRSVGMQFSSRRHFAAANATGFQTAARKQKNAVRSLWRWYISRPERNSQNAFVFAGKRCHLYNLSDQIALTNSSPQQCELLPVFGLGGDWATRPCLGTCQRAAQSN
ncbi:Hypothetical_protein [Hexamita inflata]|uniref:Hypothetical_protein n=1 Tax=Hexamita inflata TaxID=28002 RepID=A0AA86NS46_9EUKA|nr:Hypothetical protein HINF_LOCUS12081 [Hexamita inflata]